MDTPTLMTVVIALAICLTGVVFLTQFARGKFLPPIAVEIARSEGGYAATFTPRRGVSRQILDSGMSILFETYSAGDGLLESNGGIFDKPVTVHLVAQPDDQEMVFTRGDDLARPLKVGTGGAAWIRYRDMPDAPAATALVLWKASDRENGKRPKVIRGSHADEWIKHIRTPDSIAPISRLERIRTAITPGWVADPDSRQTVGVVSTVLGVVLAIAVTLVVLDVGGFRTSLPLTSEYDWLGFAGGVVGGVAGGVMTLAGVLLTLRKSTRAELQRQHDEGMRLRVSVMPLLDLKISEDPSYFDGSRPELARLGLSGIHLGEPNQHIDHNAEMHKLALLVHNIGLGHARIRHVAVGLVGESGAIYRRGGITSSQMGILQIGEGQTILMGLQAPLNAPKKAFNVRQLTLTIYYEDLLGNRYSQLMEVTFFGDRPSGMPGFMAGVVSPAEFVGEPDNKPFWFT